MNRQVLEEAVEALGKLIGTPEDPNIGWRGTGTNELYACEHCNRKDDDCLALQHSPVCPVPAARAALASLRRLKKEASVQDPKSDQAMRSPKDYAIEHAEYMAVDADRLLAAIEALSAAELVREESGEDDDGTVADARDSVWSATSALEAGVYEFRKRRARARDWLDDGDGLLCAAHSECVAALASLRAALAEPAKADQTMEVLQELIAAQDEGILIACMTTAPPAGRWKEHTTRYVNAWDRARALVKEWQAAQLDSVTPQTIAPTASTVEAPSTPEPGASLAIPDGWKLVPIEPTFEMLDAYSSTNMTNLIDILGDDPEAVDPAAPYRAMLAVTPVAAPAANGGWEQDALRYRWLRTHASGQQDSRGRQEFSLPDPHPLGNIMRGSVAQHLDEAIDDQIRKEAGNGQN